MTQEKKSDDIFGPSFGQPAAIYLIYWFSSCGLCGVRVQVLGGGGGKWLPTSTFRRSSRLEGNRLYRPVCGGDDISFFFISMTLFGVGATDCGSGIREPNCVFFSFRRWIRFPRSIRRLFHCQIDTVLWEIKKKTCREQRNISSGEFSFSNPFHGCICFVFSPNRCFFYLTSLKPLTWMESYSALLTRLFPTPTCK